MFGKDLGIHQKAAEVQTSEGSCRNGFFVLRRGLCFRETMQQRCELQTRGLW